MSKFLRGMRAAAAAMVIVMAAAKGAAAAGPGALELRGDTALIDGPPLRVESGRLQYWHDADTAAVWNVPVGAACTVEVELLAAVEEGFAGSTFTLQVGDQTLRGRMAPTPGWDAYRPLPLGTAELPAGTTIIRLQPTHLSHGVFGNVRGVRLLGLATAAAVSPSDDAPDEADQIAMYATGQFDGTRLSRVSGLTWSSDRPADGVTIAVDPRTTFQEFEGFGGAFTEAAAHVWSRLGPERQEEVLRAYFDADSGLGYRMGRTHINSCDFCLESYAYADVPGDVELEHFSIEHDRREIIPLIKAAQRVTGADALKLLASPWSPPAWMKTNGQMIGGGKLMPEYRDAWARYYCRYVQEYASEGIDIWGVSVQNEPQATQRWESCLYTAQEERDFVRDFLGPELHRQGLERVKLIVWDHNRDALFHRAATVFDDPQAAKFVWGAGFHWYVSDDYDQVEMVHQFYPDKKLLFTEGCLERGPHLGDWSSGERYARSIINDLNRWTVGWLDWNLLLNLEGGPNHVQNFCSAPILADVANDLLIFNSSYYYIGHFARFIRPGAKRVLCNNTGEDLLTTAFLNSDGQLAVVIFNAQDYAVPFSLKLGLQQAAGVAQPHSIATLLLDEQQSRASF